MPPWDGVVDALGGSSGAGDRARVRCDEALSHSESDSVELGQQGSRAERLTRFVLAALRIASSTIALVELLRSDWAGGVSASMAWLLFVQVERRWRAGGRP